MDKIIAAVLFSWAGSATAAGHTMDVRVSNGKTTFSQTVKLSDGQQANFVGPVAGGKSMIFNALLVTDRGQAAPYHLQYQLELSGGQGSQAPSLEVQSALDLRPGLSLITAECGSWTAELSLDAPGTLGKKKAPAAWDDAGLGNYRLTVDVVRGSAQQRCAVTVAPGAQANVIDRFTREGKKHGFIFSVLPAARAGGVNLQYQLEYTPVGMEPLQLQNQESLAFGRKSQTPGHGYKLGLLAEAAPIALEAPARTPPADAESKGVPLLR
ncbi:MAG: hypothetical protein NTY77_07665 [Elusimicrobia bacterium]|nr:hypothetical protein [Elusimicrobiota bacterium]